MARSYISVSEGTTSCNSLALCGCLPSDFATTNNPSFIGTVDAPVFSATTCVKTPTIVATSDIRICNGSNLGLVASAGSNDTGDIVFFSGGTLSCEWARIWSSTNGCLYYRNACGSLTSWSVYHSGNISGATAGNSTCLGGNLANTYAPIASPSFTTCTIAPIVCASNCMCVANKLNVGNPASTTRDLNVGANGINNMGNFQMCNDKSFFFGSTSDSGTRYKLFTINCHAYMDFYDCLIIRSGPTSSLDVGYMTSGGTFCACQAVRSPLVCATTCFIGSGAGLTGTASSLSIGGDANNATCLGGLGAGRYIYGCNNSGSNGASTTYNSGETAMYKSGFWEVNGASWTPQTDWYWGLTAAHTSNAPTYNYSLQLIGQGTGVNAGCNFYLRTIGGGSPTPWRKIIHNGINDVNICTTSNLYTGNIIGIGSTYLDIYQNTSDGSDNKVTRIGGGGDVSTSRGGVISLYGNEAVNSGSIFISAGGTGILCIQSPTCTNGCICTTGNLYSAGDNIMSSSGNYGFVTYYSSGLARFAVGKDNVAESGSNVGSDYALYRYSDAGGYLGRPLIITRSTGNACFESCVCVTSTLYAGSAVNTTCVLNSSAINVNSTSSSVTLYYANAAKLATNTGGICVTGVVNGSSTMCATSWMCATDFKLSSDCRLKTNIKPMEISPVNVEYKQFELISEPNCLRYGVIAQDLQEEYPELINTGENGMMGVSYIGLLIKEVAYLKCKVCELEKRIV